MAVIMSPTALTAMCLLWSAISQSWDMTQNGLRWQQRWSAPSALNWNHVGMGIPPTGPLACQRNERPVCGKLEPWVMAIQKHWSMWCGIVPQKVLVSVGATKPDNWSGVTLPKKTTDDGETYLEWNERLMKTRAGNPSHQHPFAPKIFQNVKCPSRCPIRLYELYKSKRPSDTKCDAFFLGVNHNRPHDSSAWFVDMPMGVNQLGQIMSRAAKSAGLTDGKFSNHSVCRTM